MHKDFVDVWNIYKIYKMMSYVEGWILVGLLIQVNDSLVNSLKPASKYQMFEILYFLGLFKFL